jgi:hypothetical protein
MDMARAVIVRLVKTFGCNTLGDVASFPPDIAVQLVEKGAGVKLGELDLATETWDELAGKAVPKQGGAPAFAGLAK